MERFFCNWLTITPCGYILINSLVYFEANRILFLCSSSFYFFPGGSTASARWNRQSVNQLPPSYIITAVSGSHFAEKADRPVYLNTRRQTLGGHSSGAKRAVSGARTISATRLGISIVSKNEALASAGRFGAVLPVYFQIENKRPSRLLTNLLINTIDVCYLHMSDKCL